MSWPELEQAAGKQFPNLTDVTRGPANAHTRLRLFDRPEGTVPGIILYRDNHYWCPYCEKIQLFLECKQEPYSMDLVTMFCYGEKEPSYKRLVPSGMLPALNLEGEIVTESDDILVKLEDRFGPLKQGEGMSDPAVVALRRRERLLFRAWCNWLCRPSRSEAEEEAAARQFSVVAAEVERGLMETPGPFMLGDDFGIGDIVYVPYLERMSASLYYYKGFNLRDEHPKIGEWFSALEGLECYRGMMSDFHTHAHDLPPQMGGCYTSGSAQATAAAASVDNGPFTSGLLLGNQLDPAAYPEPADSKAEAAHRLLRHRTTLLAVNPVGEEALDVGLRDVVRVLLFGGEPPEPTKGVKGVDAALRYVRDRVSVPRDMPIWSGARLRDAIEAVARGYGNAIGPPIASRNRYDQDPRPFKDARAAALK
jgi:glutathione S-transferase